MKKRLLFLPFLFAALLWTYPGEVSADGNPNEVIFLQTDRSQYIAGEYVFFSINLVRLPENTEPLSQIAYLALRGEHGIVDWVSFRLHDNHFTGSLYLPDTLSSGYFEMIAFTNWMRNFGEEYFTRMTILVANRFDEKLEFLDQTPENIDPETLSIFPEGGTFIANLPARIIILSEDQPLPTHRSVSMTSLSGDTVARAMVNPYGWASLEFCPEPGMHYQAVIEGLPDPVAFAPPLACGHTLSLSSEPDSIRVAIGSNTQTPASLVLKIFHYDKILEETTIQNGNFETLNLKFGRDAFEPGLILFRLHENGSQVAERAWFIPENRQEDCLVNTRKENFGRREQVRLEITPRELEESLVWHTLSVVQAREEKGMKMNFRAFTEGMLLARETGMPPAEVFKLWGYLGPGELNERLMAPLPAAANGEVREMPKPVFLKETSLQTLTGRVTDRATGQPVAHARIILNAPDTLVNLQYSETNPGGLFSFFLTEYYAGKELWFTPDPETLAADVNIEIFDKFQFTSPFKPLLFAFQTMDREIIRENQEIIELNKVFGIEPIQPATLSQAPAWPPLVFSEPLFSITLDEYIPLDNLGEIARELIPPWKIRTSREGLTHSLISNRTGISIPGTPALFIDGIITFSLQPLLELGSDQLKEIQVFNLHWKYGDMTFPGIVALFSRNLEYQRLAVNPEPLVFYNRPHFSPGLFRAPAYDPTEQPSERVPDLRQVLYWHSDTSTFPGLLVKEFYTGDILDTFIITLQGETRSGRYVFEQRTITVE